LFLTFVFIALGPVSVHSHGRIDFETVAAIARKSAAEASRAPQRIPEFLTNISYDRYRDIRFDAEKSLWRGRGNFQVQFIHPGLYYAHR
jgi:glucans biosynthesis protein